MGGVVFEQCMIYINRCRFFFFFVEKKPTSTNQIGNLLNVNPQ